MLKKARAAHSMASATRRSASSTSSRAVPASGVLPTCTCPRAGTLGRAAALRGSVEPAQMSPVPGLRAGIRLLPMDVEAHFGDSEDLP